MTEPTPAEIRAELARILASECFAQAGRASDFLRFVVEETLAGRAPRLKGYAIAVEVFGRSADFDPQTDPLVRVEAGRLRGRLVEYYEEEGASNPVRVALPRGRYAPTWRYAAGAEPVVASSKVEGLPTGRTEGWRWVVAGCVTAFVATLGVAAWQALEIERLRVELAQQAEADVPEGPRIVVTPLENLTPTHTHLSALSASLTEEIMLAFGERDLRVISGDLRNEGAKGAPRPGSSDYVLSGTVRGGAEGERIRITVRLVDAATGGQIWSRAYDQPHAIESLPELQSLVAADVGAIAAPFGPIFEAEVARARSANGRLSLADCEVRYFDYRRTLDAGAFRRALECYQSVSLREPDVAAMWAGLAMLYLDDYGYRYGNMPSLQASFVLAQEATERALSLDRHLMLAKLALARTYFFSGQHEQLDRTVDEVLALNPDSAEARAYLGPILAIVGNPRGVALIDDALRMSPKQPSLVHLGYVIDHMRHGRAAEALASAQKVEPANWFISHMAIAAAAGLAGDERVAERARWRLLHLYPNFEAEAYDFFDQWQHDDELRDIYIGALRAAGLNIVEPGASATLDPAGAATRKKAVPRRAVRSE